MPKTLDAILTCFDLNPFFQTRNNAIPINTNKLIQTGENIQFGGLNEGFWIVAYHVWIAGVVKNEPIKPASWQITIADMSLMMFMGFIDELLGYRLFKLVGMKDLNMMR